MIMRILTVSILTAACLGAPLATAAEDMTSRLRSVESLLSTSKAAQQIDASDDPRAKAKREEARALYRLAVDAVNAGDSETGKRLLNKASVVMFQAVRLAGTENVFAEKRERDFQERLKSVKAFVESHTQITGEKGLEAADDDLRRIVGAKIAEAEALHEAKKYLEARKVLDEAYAAAKIAIEQLRGGETVVRTLHFETKEEEYRYEVDRNDTHQMLVNMLLKEKLDANENLNQMVQKLMQQAAKTRTDAEQQAASGDYDAAVETMERATKQILRAIRSAGIYIPG